MAEEGTAEAGDTGAAVVADMPAVAADVLVAGACAVAVRPVSEVAQLVFGEARDFVAA